MPGLPRKSTANQFKKLMKKSGKARSNKSSGASDPSTRKIATYEQYCLMREAINPDDPYDEENWDDNKDLKEIYDLLVPKFDWTNLGYELVFMDDGCIELLESIDDELIANDNFYFAIRDIGRPEEVGIEMKWVQYRTSIDRKKKSTQYSGDEIVSKHHTYKMSKLLNIVIDSIKNS